jgi:hypothetical protein
VHFDLTMALASFVVGIVVGLTGMGGGALMTPMLTVFFGVPPLAAVSSDLVASAVMKPVGSIVHLRRRTVNLRLVGWLCVGSVPSAFFGVLIARSMGSGKTVENVIQIALGVALVIAAAGIAVRGYMSLRERSRGRSEPLQEVPEEIVVRPIPTLLVGILGGLVVGLTSVGSGSLIIVAMLALYPSLKANRLVGTDMVQAVPLVWSAALGHLLFGDFSLPVTLALLVGSIPGVWVGSLVSSRAPGGLIRRILAFVLLASALKEFSVPNLALLVILGAAVVATSLAWMVLRVRQGLPALSVRAAEREPVRAAD